MTRYYYLNAANQQCGPIEPTAFAAHRLTQQTYVWCEGMADWTRVCDVPGLSEFIPPVYAPGAPVGSPVGGVAKPDSHLVFAIISSVISFFLTGIVLVGLGIYAIVCASKVDNLWYNGRIDEAYEQAAKAHKWAKWCLIGNGIVYGLIIMLVIVLALIFAMNSAS